MKNTAKDLSISIFCTTVDAIGCLHGTLKTKEQGKRTKYKQTKQKKNFMKQPRNGYS
jgi:hypothetical protein